MLEVAHIDHHWSICSISGLSRAHFKNVSFWKLSLKIEQVRTEWESWGNAMSGQWGGMLPCSIWVKLNPGWSWYILASLFWRNHGWLSHETLQKRAVYYKDLPTTCKSLGSILQNKLDMIRHFLAATYSEMEEILGPLVDVFSHYKYNL